MPPWPRRATATARSSSRPYRANKSVLQGVVGFGPRPLPRELMSRIIADFSRTYAAGAHEHTPGQRGRDHRGYEYIFVKAGSTVPANHAAVVTETHEALQITNIRTDRGDRVAIAFERLNDGRYGWLCIYGTGDLFVQANCAANTTLYTSGDAGVLDDSAAGQQQVSAITLTTARGGADWTGPSSVVVPLRGVVDGRYPDRSAHQVRPRGVHPWSALVRRPRQ